MPPEEDLRRDWQAMVAVLREVSTVWSDSRGREVNRRYLAPLTEASVNLTTLLGEHTQHAQTAASHYATAAGSVGQLRERSTALITELRRANDLIDEVHVRCHDTAGRVADARSALAQLTALLDQLRHPTL